MITCEQCAVWRPREDVTFEKQEQAIEHAVLVHPSRVIAMLTEHGYLRLGFITTWLRDCRALEKQP